MSGGQGSDGSGIGDHNASAFLRSRLPFAQINLIIWCVLIFSVVRGCDPTKEPPTPDIMPRFAVVLGQVVSASLTRLQLGESTACSKTAPTSDDESVSAAFCPTTAGAASPAWCHTPNSLRAVHYNNAA
jgi:hypothetical protein